jgi:hypothetical protein
VKPLLRIYCFVILLTQLSYILGVILEINITASKCLHSGEHKCHQCGMHFDFESNIQEHEDHCYSNIIQQDTLIKYNFDQWVEYW